MAIPLTFKKPAKPASTAPVAEPADKPDERVALARRLNAELKAFNAAFGSSLSNYIAASDQRAAQAMHERSPEPAMSPVEVEAFEVELGRPGQTSRPDFANLASSLDQHLQAAFLAGDETLTGPERKALALLAYRINLVFSLDGASGSAGA